jgi:hypothetical protein
MNQEFQTSTPDCSFYSENFQTCPIFEPISPIASSDQTYPDNISEIFEEMSAKEEKNQKKQKSLFSGGNAKNGGNSGGNDDQESFLKIPIEESEEQDKNGDYEEEKDEEGPDGEDLGLENVVDLTNPMVLLQAFAKVLGKNANADGRESKLVSFPEFRGGEQDPLQWLEDFENACAANRITERRMFEIVPLYLKGMATTWWREYKPQIQRWKALNQDPDDQRSFEVLFKKQFCTEHHVDRWLEQLGKRVQRPGETVDEYHTDLDALYRKADPDYEISGQQRKRQFIRGLRRELREPVQIAIPKSLQQALERARAAEAAFSQDIPLGAYSLNRHYLAQTAGADPEFKKLQTEFQTFTKEVKELLARPNSSTQATRSNNPPDTRRCHACNKVGHIQRNCRFQGQQSTQQSARPTRPCPKCQGHGHWASECPTPSKNTNRNTNNQTQRNTTTNNQRSSDRQPASDNQRSQNTMLNVSKDDLVEALQSLLVQSLN